MINLFDPLYFTEKGACTDLDCPTGSLIAAQQAEIVVLALEIDGTFENEVKDRVNIGLPLIQHQLAGKYVKLFAENTEKFFVDFAAAFGKLLELDWIISLNQLQLIEAN